MPTPSREVQEPLQENKKGKEGDDAWDPRVTHVDGAVVGIWIMNEECVEVSNSINTGRNLFI